MFPLYRIIRACNPWVNRCKMAKLDFFVRYPQFFEKACKVLGSQTEPSSRTVESSMIRFHYGPWDDRYYHVLGYLEAKGLLSVSKVNQSFTLALTEQGKSVATTLARDASF